ncbi:unnamed protein product [Closterium sp. Naga37s-1]|nr:unnamed protein product [Closterium sp. Naga37s-1]CAI5487077.1 unnamed protein product [Closterium sp. Naga37s-1]
MASAGISSMGNGKAVRALLAIVAVIAGTLRHSLRSLAPRSHAPSCSRRHAFNAPLDSAHTRWMPNELAPSSVPLPCHMPLPCSVSPPAVASSSSSERVGPSADRHADDNQRAHIQILAAPLCQPSRHVAVSEGAGGGAVAAGEHVWQGYVPRDLVLPGSRVQRTDVGRFREWPTEVRLPFLLALLPCSYALDAARLLPHLINDRCTRGALPPPVCSEKRISGAARSALCLVVQFAALQSARREWVAGCRASSLHSPSPFPPFPVSPFPPVRTALCGRQHVSVCALPCRL